MGAHTVTLWTPETPGTSVQNHHISRSMLVSNWQERRLVCAQVKKTLTPEFASLASPRVPTETGETDRPIGPCSGKNGREKMPIPDDVRWGVSVR
ncbi:unnamed protein product, partial [Nesidiocoris tenuis]